MAHYKLFDSNGDLVGLIDADDPQQVLQRHPSPSPISEEVAIREWNRLMPEHGVAVSGVLYGEDK